MGEHDHASGGAPRPGDAASAPAEAPRSRYAVVTRDDEAWVQSSSAPHLRLHIDPGLTVAGAERKRYPRQAIFLDGAHAGPPFLDNEARQYSLDHHEGCIRAFTAAACEQAVIMVLQGLPLEQGEWHLYLNQPDADALLAAWVLLNHAELAREDRRLLRHVLPFVRLEGAIDNHGFDGAILAALPAEVEAAWRSRLDALVAHERAARPDGAWAPDRVLEFACAQLERLDGILLPQEFLEEIRAVEELERVELDGGVAAVWCRSAEGIYDVEALLQERHGGHVGVILLELGPGRFTLRQTATFLTRDLTHLYPLLNRRDPHVRDRRGGDRWGGSAQIGGAPREAGSGLDGAAIMAAIARTYRRRRFWDWLLGRGRR